MWRSKQVKFGFFSLYLVLSAVAYADDGEDTVAMEPELLAAAPKVADYTPLTDPPILWTDKDEPEREGWGPYELKVINMVFDRLDKAQDMSLFCPKYATLDRDQKIIVWGQLFAAVANWESMFDPTNRWLEQSGPSSGTDAVTGQPIISEGLLQLSYQDTKINGADICRFDPQADAKLDKNDAHRTILNPYTNLYCGINIMAQQIDHYQKVVIDDGFYWSTLQQGNFMENRVPQIRRMVSKNTPFCGKIRTNIFQNIGDFLIRKFEDIIVPMMDKGSDNGGEGEQQGPKADASPVFTASPLPSASPEPSSSVEPSVLTQDTSPENTESLRTD